jgi:MFS family permease
MADRYDCRKVIQVAQIMYMGVSAAWAFLFFTDTIQLWHACVLLVIHGMAGVLWGPGSQLLIHDIVGAEQLQSAVRLNSTSRQLGVLFGPAVGGGLILLLSPAMGLVVNALIYLPLTLWLLTVPYTGPRREGTSPVRRPLRWRDAFEIIREVSGNRPIITMVVLAGCVSFFVGSAFQATMPEFAHDLGTEKADLAYSALLGANAAGAVIGGFLLEGRGWLPPRVGTAMISAILWCLAITGFALSTSYYLSLLFLFTAGVLNLTFSSMGQTIATAIAAAASRPPDRFVRDGQHGLSVAASLWAYWGIDQCALVAGVERDGATDYHSRIVRLHDSRAGTGIR